MLNKDQVFSINDFINDNAIDKLWKVSEKLIDISSSLVENDQQKHILNKFIVKNGDRRVFELEKSIYNLFNEIINVKEICVTESELVQLA